MDWYSKTVFVSCHSIDSVHSGHACREHDLFCTLCDDRLPYLMRRAMHMNLASRGMRRDANLNHDNNDNLHFIISYELHSKNPVSKRNLILWFSTLSVLENCQPGFISILSVNFMMISIKIFCEILECDRPMCTSRYIDKQNIVTWSYCMGINEITALAVMS